MRSNTMVKHIIMLIISFVYLFLLQEIYLVRDNINYYNAFIYMQDLDFIESYFTFKLYTGGSEPLLFLFYFAMSPWIDYIFSTTLINFLFLLILYIVLGKFFTKRLLVFVILICTDYYLVRLLGELHRFKVAIMFFMLALYFDSIKIKVIAFLFSILGHFQILILLFYVMLKSFFNEFSFKSPKFKNSYFFILILFIIVLSLFYTQLMSKINYYIRFDLPISTLAIGLFYSLFLFIAKHFKDLKIFLLYFCCIFLFTLFLGSDRMNIFLFDYIFLLELYKFLEKRKYISMIVIFPIVIYNLYRIMNFYNNLQYMELIRGIKG